MENIFSKGVDINKEIKSPFIEFYRTNDYSLNEAYTFPIINAVRRGHLEIFKYFIEEKGANINASTIIITRSSAFDRRTTFLVEAGNLEIVKYLLEKGGNINDKDDKGRTALIYASMSVDLETVKYLIEKGADVNAKDNNGSTALMDASSGGCLEIIKYLIEKGADVNAKDNNGSTALIYASRKGHLETVEYLLEKGADVNIKNNNGETALDFTKKELQELHLYSICVCNNLVF